jgi:starvation-inducible outer membrane lipoprotein
MVKVFPQSHEPNMKGSTMTRTLATLLLAAAAISGCSSLPDSIKGPFARSGQTATDAGPSHTEVSPYPAETDEGKF